MQSSSKPKRAKAIALFATSTILCITWLVLTRGAHAAEEDKEPIGVSQRDWRSLRLTVADLIATYGDRYARGRCYQDRLEALQHDYDRWSGLGRRIDVETKSRLEQLEAQFNQLRREALLSNPQIDFDRLLLVKRKSGSPKLGLPTNWQGNCSLPRQGFDDEIAVLAPVCPDGKLTTLFKPDGGRFVGDVDLHFDADRLLFSSFGADGRWQVFEIGVDGSGYRQVTPGDEDDVDNYDACYLPNGEIIYTSTACFQGVPCVRGSDHVANLYLIDRQGKNVRQLTFDQDHDWCPTVLGNGRVLYLRWEYSDLPHFVSRILFHMNPDGTEQLEYYGSNSYWPNSMFHARPVPSHPSKFVTVISGHHDVSRMGQLVVFDTSKGRHEADGAVQRILEHGKKVEPILRDALVVDSWPKFLHPWPLSDKYFIVSAKPTAKSPWGVYLVDVFDNMLLLKQLPGSALLEPIPLRKTERPPVIPSRVRPDRRDALVYLNDVYAGPGLEGVPRGAVKQLRLFTYHYSYQGMGGQVDRVGLDGPWDIKRIMGTVPVEPDGSAMFRIPANTPISVQPLDAEGKALQLMRSWFVGMPGETVSCVGCHERQKRTSSNRPTMALSKSPSDMTPWYGPTRGFSFQREVQPVLDRYCVGCHDGGSRPDGSPPIDLRRQPGVYANLGNETYRRASRFSPSYLTLRSFVRTPTMESDMHLLVPMDFHADTTRLVQMLRKGHYGVKLDQEAWDRLITWIDLNAPAHGTWGEIVGEHLVSAQRDRRRALLVRYASRDEDPEAIYDLQGADLPMSTAVTTKGENAPPMTSTPLSVDRWPFDADEAKRRQERAGDYRLTVHLGNDIELDLVLIPAGQFLMGDPHGHSDEKPLQVARNEMPFWIGRCEVTNQQYRQFDPSHDSRLEHGDFLHFSQEQRGDSLNDPRQPVVRISWYRAMAFCKWLSAKTGRSFTLPTETQWEYACRAGTDTPLAYGGVDDDFSQYANLADASLEKRYSFEPWKLPVTPIHAWRPADSHFNDHYRVSAHVGSYLPNAWNLHDMHGNVAEWTLSQYHPDPYDRDRANSDGRRVVRGGSWSERPQHARSAYRLSYRPYQGVYNVGFRVACEMASER